MTKPPKKPRPEDIETDHGADERFERTVRRMLDTPPKPHKQIPKRTKKGAPRRPK